MSTHLQDHPWRLRTVRSGSTWFFDYTIAAIYSAVKVGISKLECGVVTHLSTTFLRQCFRPKTAEVHRTEPAAEIMGTPTAPEYGAADRTV